MDASKKDCLFGSIVAAGVALCLLSLAFLYSWMYESLKQYPALAAVIVVVPCVLFWCALFWRCIYEKQKSRLEKEMDSVIFLV